MTKREMGACAIGLGVLAAFLASGCAETPSSPPPGAGSAGQGVGGSSGAGRAGRPGGGGTAGTGRGGDQAAAATGGADGGRHSPPEGGRGDAAGRGGSETGVGGSETGVGGAGTLGGTSNGAQGGSGASDDHGGEGAASGDGGADAGAGGEQTGNGGNPGTGGTGGGTSVAECSTAADCETVRGHASPCGTWGCDDGNCRAVSDGCSDADGDGYGTGSACACAGIDCDDTNPSSGASARRICNVTPSANGCFESIERCEDGVWGECQLIPGELVIGGEACNGEDEDCDGEIDEDLGDFSCGLGACRRTVPACSHGVLGSCIPGTPTTATDGCNGSDDDCDGAVDEDCTTCIKVSPAGDDAAAAASNGATPFLDVQRAIDFAAAHPNVATQVCVAAGAACGASHVYPGPAGAALTMRDGIDVLGGYESTTFTRCSDSSTILEATTGQGVLFPSSVTSATVLDGFTITRFASDTTAGVTVDGATGAVLSSLVIDDGVNAVTSAGVNVLQGGLARIVRSRIFGGNGSAQAFGVHSVGARVVLEENCSPIEPATGRCTGSCSNAPLRIQGRTSAGSAATAAVWLEASPDSRIESSLLCAPAGDNSPSPAGLHVSGNASDVVIRTSSILQASGDSTTHRAIWLEGCSGATPWIVDNDSISVDSGPNHSSKSYGIEALGDCHPVIDQNRVIVAAAQNANTSLGALGSVDGCAIHCGSAGAATSRCVLDGNEQIYSTGGAGTSHMEQQFTGVSCSDAACAKIARNVITGRMGYQSCTYCGTYSYGLGLTSSRALVDRNLISAGCAVFATGVLAATSGARLQNNQIRGLDLSVCGGSSPTRNDADYQSEALALYEGSGTVETDVHSNKIFDSSLIRDKSSLTVSHTGPAVGILRNNLIYPGCTACDTARVVEANVICDDPDCVFWTDALIDKGVTTQAPLWDFDGRNRDAAPDIGPFEY
jgi:hypothetical protein